MPCCSLIMRGHYSSLVSAEGAEGAEGAEYSVLSYATHAQGTFEALRAALPNLVVGGWGAEWRSYMQKMHFVLEYCSDKNPKHIVIFLDGFDTHLRGDPAVAVSRFKGLPSRCRVLLSTANIELLLPPLLRKRIFDCSSSEACCNAGMYMGYASEIYSLFSDALALTDHFGDDQRAIELIRKGRDGVCLDSECLIFRNLSYTERGWGEERLSEATEAIFIGRNGSWDPTCSGTLLCIWKLKHYAAMLRLELGACCLGLLLGVAAANITSSMHGDASCSSPFSVIYGHLFPAVVVLYVFVDDRHTWAPAVLLLLAMSILGYNCKL